MKPPVDKLKLIKEAEAFLRAQLSKEEILNNKNRIQEIARFFVFNNTFQ